MLVYDDDLVATHVMMLGQLFNVEYDYENENFMSYHLEEFLCVYGKWHENGTKHHGS